jgi:4-amino-4-deoxy-L-arabinose transferase-like glycosyltransferase
VRGWWRRCQHGRVVEVVASGLVAILFFSVGSCGPLLGRDEGRFAQASREMVASGDLVVPTFGGVDRYHKPILIYWCVAASFVVFGESEWSARLPSIVAASLAVVVLAAAACRRWGRGAGALAGLLLASSLVFAVEGRACTADMVMLLPTLLAMLAFGEIWEGRDSRATAGVLWLGLGVAVLAKGPVGPAVAVMTAVALWALQRPWRAWEGLALAVLVTLGWCGLGPLALVVPVLAACARCQRPSEWWSRLRAWWGIPLSLAVVLPWGLAAIIRTDGAYLREGVGHHVLRRSLEAFESHGGFPGFYLLTAAVVALPWFAPLVEALLGSWRWITDDPYRRFLLAWLIGPLVLFEMTQTKLVHYWLPSYPAGILLVVAWLRQSDRPRVGLPGWLVWAIGAAAAGGVPILAAMRLEIPELVPLALACGGPLVIGLVVAILRPRRAPVSMAVASATFVVMLLTVFVPCLVPHLVVSRTAAAALDQRRLGEGMVVYKLRDDELLFSLPLDTLSCRDRACLRSALEQGEGRLGIARVRDLAELGGEVPLEVVQQVHGVDLVHGQWVDVAFFRGARQCG